MRVLLTLLALMSGLALYGAPAQVRATEFSSPQVERGSDETRKAQRQRICKLAKDKKKPAPACRGENTRDNDVTTIFIPTVQLGPDRALE